MAVSWGRVQSVQLRRHTTCPWLFRMPRPRNFACLGGLACLCFSAVLTPKCTVLWTDWASMLCEDSAKTSSETSLLQTTIRHQLAVSQGDVNKKPFTSILSGNQISKQGGNHSLAVYWCLAIWAHLKRDEHRLCTSLSPSLCDF